jgi:hypothetical protein
MRLGLGAIYSNTTVSIDGASDDITYKGGGAVFEFMLGGTPAPGLVIGGALLGHGVAEPTVEQGGQEITAENTTLSLGVFGPFVQYYFDPNGGFYLQGLLGFAQGRTTYEFRGVKFQSEPAAGGAIALGGGYDFWVGDQWSLGPELRFLFASLKADDDQSGISADYTYNVFVPSLAFTVTLH